MPWDWSGWPGSFFPRLGAGKNRVPAVKRPTMNELPRTPKIARARRRCTSPLVCRGAKWPFCFPAHPQSKRRPRVGQAPARAATRGDAVGFESNVLRHVLRFSRSATFQPRQRAARCCWNCAANERHCFKRTSVGQCTMSWIGSSKPTNRCVGRIRRCDF